MCPDERLKQAFVLCAGKGTRLFPLTTFIPKCLVPVNGEPVLTKIINHLEFYDINKIICNVGNLIKHLENYKAQNSYDFTISYEEEPLGTAGALLHNIDMLDDNFCVYYGDVLSNVNIDNLWKLHLEKTADISMFVHDSVEPWTGGVMQFSDDGRVISIEEKPQNLEQISRSINSGILIIRKACLATYISEKLFDIASDLLPLMIANSCRIFALPIKNNEYVQDMGTHERLEKASNMLNI